eukprot:1027237-Prorocentrum_minimum.AAC.3
MDAAGSDSTGRKPSCACATARSASVYVYTTGLKLEASPARGAAGRGDSVNGWRGLGITSAGTGEEPRVPQHRERQHVVADRHPVGRGDGDGDVGHSDVHRNGQREPPRGHADVVRRRKQVLAVHHLHHRVPVGGSDGDGDLRHFGPHPGRVLQLLRVERGRQRHRRGRQRNARGVGGAADLHLQRRQRRVLVQVPLDACTADPPDGTR